MTNKKTTQTWYIVNIVRPYHFDVIEEISNFYSFHKYAHNGIECGWGGGAEKLNREILLWMPKLISS